MRPAVSGWGESTTTRSPSESFFGIDGLTQITESTSTPDEWGYTARTKLLVMRAGAVVCEVPYGSSSGHENHSGHEDTSISISSRTPLRFRTRTYFRSNDGIQTPGTCGEYELSDTGSCKQLFSRECREVCKLTHSTTLSPGTGVIRGHVTRDWEPMIGATVLAGTEATISDEQGAFSISAGAGSKELAIYEQEMFEPKAKVVLEPGQDADVAIAIHCTEIR